MHAPDCTGCPQCEPEMAAILQDQIVGRYQSLANRLPAITHRTLRALRADPKHPGYRALRPREVPSPSLAEWVAHFKRSRDRISQRDALVDLMSAGQSEPMPRRQAASAPVPAAPDLAAALRAIRGNKE